jgi:hypothetical protein
VLPFADLSAAKWRNKNGSRVSSTKQSALDDEDDDGPYDPRYPGQRVVADGGRTAD